MKPSFIENIYHLAEPLYLYLEKPIEISDFYHKEVSNDQNLRILFLTGSFNKEGEILGRNAKDLFLRMVNAIGLDNDDYKLESVSDDMDGFNLKPEHLTRLKQLIFLDRPKLIVTFGADATSVFFNKKERLSNVHGIIYDKRLELDNEFFAFKVVPIFHPEILTVNIPMREIVWKDFQNLIAKKIF